MSVVALTVPLELADGGVAYTGSLSGLGVLFTVNTTGYNSISVQLSGTWVATVTFKISNDGINWTPIATTTGNGITIYPTTGIYFQAEVTAYTSGTVDALAFLRFQQVADISIDADLADIDANTAATATNTAEILQQIQEGNSVPIVTTLTANGTLFTADTLGYNTISVQLSGDWSANCTFQVSNNNVNFANVQGYTFNNYMNSINTAQDNGVYIFPVTGRYFQVVVSNYNSGTVNCTAYLRIQSLAGIGETMLTQAMDQSNNTPINVNYQNTGQKPAAASVPVTLSNENIQDTFIASRALGSPLNSGTPIPMDGAGPVATNPGGWIDVSQYRSIYIQYQVVGALTGNVNVEMSNDGVTLLNPPLNTFFDTQVLDAQATGTTGGTMNFSTNKNGTKIANLGWRYVRFRTTSTISGSGTFQLFVMLRMTLSPYVTAQTNIQAVAGSNVGSSATMKNASATQDTFPGLVISGVDRSVVRSELIGAMGAGGINNNYLYNGPYFRNAYTDLAGGMGVAGPQPFLAEDKTYPVNVRLERSTRGQDSVQDLLQQILVELKLNNHYTRETPLALATSNFSSMEDDLSEFVNDKTLYN